jgi:hypothetical protein
MSAVVLAAPLTGQLSGRAGFDVVDTKGHKGAASVQQVECFLA